MSQLKRNRAKRRRQAAEINPYLVSAAESLPRQDADAAGGAGMILLANGIGPLLVVGASAAACAVLARRLNRLCVERFLPEFDWIATIPGIMFLVGVYRLTDTRRFETISDDLRAMARLSTIVYVITLVLMVVTLVRGDGIGYGFFQEASTVVRSGVDALVALVVARHLTRVGRGAVAVAARCLALALLVAIVAGYLLTRTTHDDMLVPVPPRYAYMVLPINVALWIGKLAIFGTLWWTLAKRARSLPSRDQA